MYMPKQRKTSGQKLHIGEKNDQGYHYGSKLDFSGDLLSQIDRVLSERDLNRELEGKIDKLRLLISKHEEEAKEKNLNYYYDIGKALSFLEAEPFVHAQRYGVFRRLLEELHDILPHVPDSKVALKHLDMMFGLGHINKRLLPRASWDQWSEILKFTEIWDRPDVLKVILEECKAGLNWRPLRDRLQGLLK
jgi:hypothetical protein